MKTRPTFLVSLAIECTSRTEIGRGAQRTDSVGISDRDTLIRPLGTKRMKVLAQVAFSLKLNPLLIALHETPPLKRKSVMQNPDLSGSYRETNLLYLKREIQTN